MSYFRLCLTMILILLFSNAYAGSDKDFKGYFEECKKGVETGKDISKAIEFCTQAINIKPTADIFFYRGYLYIQDSKLDDAINDYSKAIELKPSDTEKYLNSYNNRGFAYFLKEKYDEAIADYKKALEIMPDYERAQINMKKAHKYKDATEKIKLYAEELKNKPVRESYRKLAIAYSEKNDYKMAIEVLDSCILRLKEQCRYYGLRGSFKVEAGNKEDAYDDLTKALQDNPEHPEVVYYWRAKTYKFEEYDKKITDLKKAVEIDPNYKDALWSLGWVLDNKLQGIRGEVKQQTLKEAIKIFSRLIELEPEYDVRVYRFRVGWNMELETPNCQQAIADRKRAAAINKEDDLEINYLAETLVQCKDFTAAINIYHDLLKTETKFKSRAAYLLDAAKAYMLKNDIAIMDINKPYKRGEDLQTAIKYLSEAIRTFPSCIRDKNKGGWGKDEKDPYSCFKKNEAFAFMGLIYEAIGKNDRAIENFSKAINTFPYGSLHTHRGVLFFEKGDYKQALSDCEESVKSKSPFDSFGNIYCTDEFMNRIKDKILTKSKKSTKAGNKETPKNIPQQLSPFKR